MELFEKKCSVCGHANPSKNKFCAQCGAPLGIPSSSSSEAAREPHLPLAESSNLDTLSEKDQRKKEVLERRIAGYEKYIQHLPNLQKLFLFFTIASGIGLLLLLLLGGFSLKDSFGSLSGTLSFFLLFFFMYFLFFTLYSFLFMKRQNQKLILRLRKQIEKLYRVQNAKTSPAETAYPQPGQTVKKSPGIKSLILPVVSLLFALLLLSEIVPIAINTIFPDAYVKAPFHLVTSLVNLFSGGTIKAGRCAQIPMTHIRFDWCNRSQKPPSGVDSDFVWCQYTSDQVPAGGHGFFPPECTPF